MYYQFTIVYKDGPKTGTVEPQELQDQIDYCRAGKRAGWITDWWHSVVQEEW